MKKFKYEHFQKYEQFVISILLNSNIFQNENLYKKTISKNKTEKKKEKR